MATTAPVEDPGQAMTTVVNPMKRPLSSSSSSTSRASVRCLHLVDHHKVVEADVDIGRQEEAGEETLDARGSRKASMYGAAVFPVTEGGASNEDAVAFQEPIRTTAPASPSQLRPSVHGAFMGSAASSRTQKLGRWVRRTWCSGNIVVGTTLLFFLSAATALYFVAQTTSMLQDLMGLAEDPRSWMGITDNVALCCWIFLVPAMLLCVYTFVQITCCWRRTVFELLNEDRADVAMEKNSLCLTCFHCFMYFVGPHSPYFFWLNYGAQLGEFIFQALAVEQMSRDGLSDISLAVYTCAIFVSGFGPLILAWITHHLAQDPEGDEEQLRSRIGQLIARAIMLDAACDVFYVAFPIGHLLTRFVIIDGGGVQGPAFNLLDGSGVEGRHQGGLVPYMLLANAKSTFFGADSYWDVLVKAISRIGPIYLAPFRIRRAFVTRQSWQAPDVPTEATQKRRASRRKTNASAKPSERVASRIKRKHNSALKRSKSMVRRKAKDLVRRSASDAAEEGHFKLVPWWAAVLLNFSVVCFSLAVFVRLAAWGRCQDKLARESCAVRAFPIFEHYGEDRGCSCNTLAYRDLNCWAQEDGAEERGKKSSAASPAAAAAAAAPGASPAMPSASSFLGSRLVLVESLRIVYVEACANDTKLLQILSSHLKQPDLLIIWAAKDRGSVGNQTATSSSVAAAAASSPPSSSPVTSFEVSSGPDIEPPVWAFPPTFGCPPKGASSSRCWPLIYICIRGEKNALRLESLPENLGRMTALKDLTFEDTGLTSLPSSIGELWGLLVIEGVGNKLKSLPSSIGKLTQLHRIILDHNLLTRLPTSMGQLTKLKEANLGHNMLSTLPTELGSLAGLSRLHLPANNFSTVPSSFLAAPRGDLPLYLDLEANNISASEVQAAMKAATPGAAGAAGAGQPTRLLRIGKNPACAAGTANGTVMSRILTQSGSSWRVVCENQCALGCRDMSIGDRLEWSLGDGYCDSYCDRAACDGFDGGDCDSSMKRGYNDETR